ncbi:hypothetical protein C8J57DRAFT_1490017 [Mycena rebaudengoi]|nr:hypothetical protein C8J57DRAFT_1490017 [Mycena rebaudengoi]
MAALAPVVLATVRASHGSAGLESHSSGGMPHDADRPVISAACTALHTTLESNGAIYISPLRPRSTRLSLPHSSLRLTFLPPLSNSQSHPASRVDPPAVYTYLLARPSSLHHMPPLPASRRPPAHSALLSLLPPAHALARTLPPSRGSSRSTRLSLLRPPLQYLSSPVRTCLPAHPLPRCYLPRVESRQRCIFRLPLPSHTYTYLPAHPFPPFEISRPAFSAIDVSPRESKLSLRAALPSGAENPAPHAWGWLRLSCSGRRRSQLRQPPRLHSVSFFPTHCVANASWPRVAKTAYLTII